MASDKSQFNQALKKWDYLQELGRYSEPIQRGDVAILVSGYGLAAEDISAREEVAHFQTEALEMATSCQLRGIGAFIINRFTYADVQTVMEDQSISSIITIGNGDLSSVYMDDGNSLDWRHIAAASTHLKTGRFSQRHCGQAIRDLSVPLGTFAMTRHDNVRAAVNRYLPTFMEQEDEYEIQTIHTHERLDYRTVKTLLPHQNFEKHPDSSADAS